jgi:hypothetical protein
LIFLKLFSLVIPHHSRPKLFGWRIRFESLPLPAEP